MYTTDKTYEDLLNMVNDLRRGNLKHDDIVIAEWIKVCVLCLLWISLKFEGGGRFIIFLFPHLKFSIFHKIQI